MRRADAAGRGGGRKAGLLSGGKHYTNRTLGNPHRDLPRHRDRGGADGEGMRTKYFLLQQYQLILAGGTQEKFTRQTTSTNNQAHQTNRQKYKNRGRERVAGKGGQHNTQEVFVSPMVITMLTVGGGGDGQ